ncbi:MAG: DUF4837 family protein [Flammeovirgaceae bacterium]|jgi:hypothetical protein|nr:DUF4837 family protein [Flammeovirgaceae bacterium]
MRLRFLHHFLIISLAMMLVACGEASKKFSKDFMPSAKGDIGEIMVVADSGQWEADLGATLMSILRQPMQGLPQDEPLFSVHKISPDKLNNTLKSSANMIFLMTLDSKTTESKILKGFLTQESLQMIRKDTSLYMSIRRDEFAKGQVILYLFANTEAQLNAKLIQNREKIQLLFEKRERERMVKKLYKSHDKQMEKTVFGRHQFKMDVPFGWEQAASSDGFYWMRYFNNDKEQNIFIYYEPYTTADVFNDIPLFRDMITRKYLRDGEKNGLFIERQMRDDLQAVFTNQTHFKGHYAIESRGLWKISDNSLGGPYISYTFVDIDQKRVYYIEGYVAAPGSKKRILLQEVDAILSTFRTILIK